MFSLSDKSIIILLRHLSLPIKAKPKISVEMLPYSQKGNDLGDRNWARGENNGGEVERVQNPLQSS